MAKRPIDRDPLGKAWSQHAPRYGEDFLELNRAGVVNPILDVLEGLPGRESMTVADLGCGIGPFLPWLRVRFGKVVALDFASGMLERARESLGPDAEKVTFLHRKMHELDDLRGTLDVAVAFNSLVMPDTREIDRTLSAIRSALRPGGRFVGVVPAMDALHYHTMLLHDLALGRGHTDEEADRYASFHGEHRLYDFPFGRFAMGKLQQKFWQPFEIEYRFAKAGFGAVRLAKVLYPWDNQMACWSDLQHFPNSWDWGFVAERGG